MANTITIGASLQLAGVGLNMAGSVSVPATQAGVNAIESTVALSTTTAQISIGNIATMGYVFVKNLDATNSVRIGLATPVTSGNAFAELKPNEGLMVPTRQTVIYGIAVAGTPEILVVAVEV